MSEGVSEVRGYYNVVVSGRASRPPPFSQSGNLRCYGATEESVFGVHSYSCANRFD